MIPIDPYRTLLWLVPESLWLDRRENVVCEYECSRIMHIVSWFAGSLWDGAEKRGWGGVRKEKTAGRQ